MAKRLTVQELALAIGKASEQANVEMLNELQPYFSHVENQGILPFSTGVTFDAELVVDAEAMQESEAALVLANAWCRARRGARYRRNKRKGVRRPVIVEEGDSWHQYPIRLDDVIDVLMDEYDYQLLSLSAAGDLLSNMVRDGEYLRAVREEDADFLLISAGGNDLLGGGRLREFLKPKPEGAPPEQWLDKDRWQSFADEMVNLYRSIFSATTRMSPRTQILCHGYDYALPRDQRWLGKPLADFGVPEDERAEVVASLIDWFNHRLIDLTGEFEQAHHVDCRRVVGDSHSSWYDELHPKNTGYARVAERFHEKIQDLWNSRSQPGGELESSTSSESHSKELMYASSRLSNPTLTHAGAATAQPGSIGPATEAIVSSSFGATAKQLQQINAPAISPALLKERGVVPALTTGPSEQRAIGLPDVVRVSEGIRMAIRTVLAEHVIPEWIVDPEMRSIPGPVDSAEHQSGRVQPGDDRAALLRRPPCESLRIWQAHVSEDPENLLAYEEFRLLQLQFDEVEEASRIEQRRRLLPIAQLAPQERILGESDLFQVNYLTRGSLAARAVGRVSVFNEYNIPLGSGTGFLVGPGLLLTNHHVLSTRNLAAHSHVLFEYEYDENNGLKTTERFDLTDEVFCTSETHDFTFCSVQRTGSLGHSLSAYGVHTLIRESGKAVKGEPVSIIQHASGLPKQIAIRNSRIIGRARQFVYYITDTEQGSSGSPVLNDQWLVVGLHHRSVPHFFKTCEYVANRGIRVSSIYEELEVISGGGDRDAHRVLDIIEPSARTSSISTMAVDRSSDTDLIERNVEPFHEVPYSNRKGFDRDFLGIEIPLPEVHDIDNVAAPLLGTSGSPKYELLYQHFSIVMNRHRRLALFTAANVSFLDRDRRPDPERPDADYTRDGLGGLGRNDREKWFLDPRLATEYQLPDIFYNRDRKAFHKGHLVRRDAVAWGNSYRELRRANGDTFHVTNCSPQVGHYNMASRGGLWGKLENNIQRQSRTERLCVLSGPLFSEQDREFSGVDNDGDIIVPIPSVFWKVVIARDGNRLRAFAFWLQQDLTGVEFEFSVSARWKQHQVSLSALERMSGHLAFPSILHNADQDG